eukprot:m.118140 g.118140  ORF g.118140 m.118140 type:complete len:60 (-) comp28634_c1_seq1:75-254(-)
MATLLGASGKFSKTSITTETDSYTTSLCTSDMEALFDTDTHHRHSPRLQTSTPQSTLSC